MDNKHHFSQDWNPTPHEAHLPAKPGQRPMRKRYIFIIIAIVVVAALVAGMVLWLRSRSAKPSPSTNTTQQTGQASAQADTQPGTPKTYKSDALQIGFTYPGTWRVRENATKTQIMITSPPVSYQKGGVSTQGVFTIKMRTGIIPQGMQTTLQNINAVKKSEVIAYTEPTDQQRQYTNLSFGGKGTNMSLLMVTGGSEFNVGDAFASGLDMQGAFYLFAGGYGSDPNDTLTFDSVPLTSYMTPAVYQQAVAIIESVKIY